MGEKEITKIPFEITRIPDNTRSIGEEVVISDGVDGTRIVTRVDSQIVSDRTIHPKNKVIFYGTKEVEQDSTPESPQEELEKQPSQNVEVGSDTIQTPETHKPDSVQGSSEQSGGIKELFTMNTATLKKAALEAGRLLVFAIPGILITVLTDNPELGGSLGATILLVLKSLDRGIHENKKTQADGILPF